MGHMILNIIENEGFLSFILNFEFVIKEIIFNYFY